MMALLMSLAVSATYWTDAKDGIWYEFEDLGDNNAAIVSIGSDAALPETIEFPSSVWPNTDINGSYPEFHVVQIGTGSSIGYAGSSAARTQIVYLKIPEGVTTIAASAFYETTSLKTVVLPSTLTSVGDYAFQGCTALEGIWLNTANIPTIGTDAFKNTAEPWDKIVKNCKLYVLHQSIINTIQDAGYTWDYWKAFDNNGNLVLNDITLKDTEYWDASFYNGCDVNVKLTRSFAAGQWYTLCVPFSISAGNLKYVFGDEVVLAKLTGSALKDGVTELTFDNSLTWTEAGKPYLIKPSQNVTSPAVFNGAYFNIVADPKIETTYFDMIGSYETKALSSSDYYLADDNKLYTPATTVSMGGYRAYFQAKGGAVGAPARVRFADQTATSAEQVEAATVSKKVLRDGQLLILRDGQYYTMQGQLITF